ncbi:MAG: hypothetical protein CMI00_03465 [Oceanospirillaceae bacterium]|nr:hypothetical protein [Oceanospirillaceae bacterium]
MTNSVNTYTLLKIAAATSLLVLLGVTLCAENASGVFSEILAPTESLLYLQKGICGCLFALLLSGQFVFPATFWLGACDARPDDTPSYPQLSGFPEPDTTLRERFCRSNLSRAPPLV